MRAILAGLKFVLLWIAVGFIPVTMAKVFFGVDAGALVFLVVGFFIFLSCALSNDFLKKVLSPSAISIGPFQVWTIEDPSSHAFVTHALFSTKPTLWITRGALSLLKPDEVFRLMSGMNRAGKGRGLLFETLITAWLVRIEKKIPSDFREIVFFQKKGIKSIRIQESLRSVFWISILFLLECFYFPPKNRKSSIPEEILRKLEAEASRCVPRLPTALSSHSAVSPWPDAFLVLGRTCLLPARTVNN